MWKLSHASLDNQLVKTKIKREIKSILKREKKNKKKYNISKLMDTTKAIFRGKFVTVNAYIKNKYLKSIT